MPYYYYRFDSTYILVLIGALLSIWASSRVQSTYNKYARVRSMSGIATMVIRCVIALHPGCFLINSVSEIP